jgi:hypothetical protein
MRNSALVPLTLSVAGIVILAARISSAQTKSQAPRQQPDTGLALHQLELLVAHLDAKKDTKAIELLTDYQHALDGQQASGAMAINIRIVLQKLQEGHTQEVTAWQEDRLISDAITLYASYSQLSPEVRGALSLRSLGYVRDYFARHPRTNLTSLQKEGLAKALQLFDEVSGKKNER